MKERFSYFAISAFSCILLFPNKITKYKQIFFGEKMFIKILFIKFTIYIITFFSVYLNTFSSFASLNNVDIFFYHGRFLMLTRQYYSGKFFVINISSGIVSTWERRSRRFTDGRRHSST